MCRNKLFLIELYEMNIIEQILNILNNRKIHVKILEISFVLSYRILDIDLNILNYEQVKFF